MNSAAVLEDRMEGDMFKIGKLFHLTHVVSDLAAVDRWYDEVFAVTRYYRGYERLPAATPRCLRSAKSSWNR
jgi:hypothetical protein